MKISFKHAPILIVCVGLLVGCGRPPSPTGPVQQLRVTIPVDSQGNTVEQQNIRDRLLLDNKPGSIKHLYVVSAYSGQCILYSTVRGKVTSSGKRLKSGVQAPYGSSTGTGWYSPEVMQDDGTFGSSIEYLYWFDSRGIYHQHYVGGGQIVHISDQPLQVGSVTINVETK